MLKNLYLTQNREAVKGGSERPDAAVLRAIAPSRETFLYTGGLS